jgi:hypothetical protein
LALACKLTADLTKGGRAAHSELLADQFSVIMKGADTCACVCAAAWCGSGRVWEGAATTIITKATPSISRPATPVVHVALVGSLLITVILVTPFPENCCPCVPLTLGIGR